MTLEPEQLKVNRFSLHDTTPRCTFIHFTDLHFRGDSLLTRRVRDEFRQQKPDFACFTGDLIDEPDYTEGAFAFIKSLGCPVYGVPGNHDYRCKVPFAEYEKAFASTGGAWLENRSVVGSHGHVEIVGLATMDTHHIGRPQAAHRILLTHYPLVADALNDHDFTVVLAGHSHGGQVRVPFYGPLYLPPGVGRYDLGQFDTVAGIMSVSAGLGTSLLPIRFNCQPEITLIDI